MDGIGDPLEMDSPKRKIDENGAQSDAQDDFLHIPNAWFLPSGDRSGENWRKERIEPRIPNRVVFVFSPCGVLFRLRSTGKIEKQYMV